MNCDDVFAILTRGPFPSGQRDDRMVEAHLQVCADCQRLAEALRPNDELRPESVAPEDSVSLPGYWGGPLHLKSQPAISLTQVPGQTRPQSKHWPLRTAVPKRANGINLWHFTAAIALGIVIAAILRMLVGPNEQPASPLARGFSGIARTGAASSWIDGNRSSESENRTSAESFPRFCPRNSSTNRDYSASPSSDYRGGRSSRYNREQCCHQCHASGATRLLNDDDDAILMVQRSCVACHGEQ